MQHLIPFDIQAYAIIHTNVTYVRAGTTERSVVVVVVWRFKSQVIETSIWPNIAKSSWIWSWIHYWYKVRIGLAIFANYPRHVCELPSPPRKLPSPFDIFSERDYRFTSPLILKLRIHTRVACLLTTWVTMSSLCTWETGRFDKTLPSRLS